MNVRRCSVIFFRMRRQEIKALKKADRAEGAGPAV